MVYKGKKRCFGEFRCEECNRYWMSAYSWAETAQICRTCYIFTMPFRQSPLNKPKGKNSTKINRKIVHPQELCGKCRQLRTFCGNAEKRSH